MLLLCEEVVLTAPEQHAPGEDQYGYEDAGERWMPVHSVESIVSALSYALGYGSHSFLAVDQCNFPPVLR